MPLDYLFYIATHPNVRPFFDAALNGSMSNEMREERQCRLLLGLGLLMESDGSFDFSNEIYRAYWEKSQSC